MTSSIKAQVSVVYPKTIHDSKKDHNWDYLDTTKEQEIPKIQTTVDGITCQHPPIAFLQDTHRQMSANQRCGIPLCILWICFITTGY